MCLETQVAWRWKKIRHENGNSLSEMDLPRAGEDEFVDDCDEKGGDGVEKG